MVHWSRFAGSLWDSLLTANVSAEASAERAITFDAAVVDFFDNTFPDLIRGLDSQYRQQYVRMSFDNLRLTARRSTAIYLQIDRTDVQLYSQMAVDTLSHVQSFERNIEHMYTSALGYHSIPTLANSLLLLCSLLISDLDVLGLPLDSWIPTLHQNLESIIDVLKNKAQEILLAQHVLRDFDRILPVVQAALSRWSTEVLLSQGTPDWSVVTDVIPNHVADLLPYREQLPDIRYPSHHNGVWASNVDFQDTDRGLSFWDEGPEPGGRGNSVLWV